LFPTGELEMKLRRAVSTILFGVLAISPQLAQATNPPYLAEMPSVERVLREVRTNDPKQTALLQLQALWELPEMIKEMSGPREYGRGANGLTPDEYRLIAMYNQAHAQLVKESDERFPGPYGKWKRFSLNVAIYPTSDPRFGVDGTLLFKRFFSPAFRAEFEKAIGADAARHEEFLRAQEQADARARAQANSGDAIANANAQAIGQVFSGNDPGAVRTRRCMELGGSQLECAGKGLLTGLFQLVGANPNLGSSPVRPGIRMTGIYAGAAGTSLTFGQDSVDLSGCGKLVEESHAYETVKKGNQLVIQIASQPQPYAVVWGSDGKLAGPGLTTVNGRIITGYRNQYVPAVINPDGSGTPGYYQQVPVYAPKTERCSIGALNPKGPTPTFSSAYDETLGIFSGKAPEEAARSSKKDLPPPGPRVAGRYASQGGLQLDFQGSAVVLDCGEAHVARKYNVQISTDQLLVEVENGSAILALALQPDGSLMGSGTANVAGRVVVGNSANGVVFAPRNASCAVGRMTPAGAR
jgi:hypothetical protein